MLYLLKGIRLIALLLAVAVVSCAEPIESSPLRIAFPPAQLQGDDYVFQITQSPTGQIIAAGERISYYDNNEWKFVTTRKRSAIRALLVDGDTLWITSLSEIGRLSLPLSEKSKYETVAQTDLANAGEIWQLSKSGHYLVATTKENVWFVDPATNQANRTSLPTKNRLSQVTRDKKLNIAQPGVGIWEVNDNILSPLENPLPDKMDTSWLWGNESLLLTVENLYTKAGEGYRVIAQTKALNTEGMIVSATRWGRFLAVATIAKGLALIDLETGKISFVTRASGLPTLKMVHVFVDSSDRLWTGTSQGISVFEPLRFGHQFLLKNTPIFAFRSDGLFVSFEDQSTYFRDTGEQEIRPRTYEFLPSRSGPALGLWGKVRVGDREIFTPGNRIGAMIELPEGQLLVSSGEKLHLVEPNAQKSEPIPSPSTEITGFSIGQNVLWAATIDGSLLRAPLPPPITFSKVTTLPDNGAAKLHHLGNTLIVASRDSVRFGEQLRVVVNTAGLRTPRLASTADGTLWLLGEQQGQMRLGRLVASGGSVSWETAEAKGLTLLTDVHHLSASGSTLTITAADRILELNAAELKPTYRLSAPRLQFTFNDPKSGVSTTQSSAPPELEADTSSLTFSGTLPFDEFGERPAFERRLLPTETAWIATKAGERVAYPSLSPRDYVLEVRPTHLGHTGPVTTHAFAVLPPWYQSPFAFGGYATLAALLGYFGYRIRSAQILRRNLELERLVAERTQELAEASAAKSEFVASMSHEIRNPMNGVIGLVNILREQPALPKQANNLRLLQNCAEQLRATVDDILDFSKIEARRVGLEASPFDLLDTLEAAAATVDPAGESIRFIEKPPVGVTLRGDAAKLRQIFANYLNNALKYGVPPGARVSTILTSGDDTHLRLTLSVTSTGPTIEKDKLDKLFESFTRGEDAVERNIRGTGLGLAICKRYAEAMGGEVGAVSTNGETTFYLNVPFEKIGTTPVDPGADLVAPPRPSLPARALAIEDEDYNRIVLGDILEKMNYTVDWATTGAEALQLARENGYDIVLTDYRLPDTNGVELTKKILELCPDPKPAVFAVTAYSTRERRDECMAAGMSGFISKPITLEKLRTTLFSWGDRQLTKISLEASQRPMKPVRRAEEIESGWAELQQIAATDPKLGAERAHRLNNLCRSLRQIDIAEQLELLEGALERGEPTAEIVTAIERLMRA